MIDNLKANLMMLSKEYGFSFAELSRLAGYSSRQEFNNLFYRKYTRRDLIAIANVFGVRPGYLLRPVSPKQFGKAMADPTERIKENLTMILAEHGMSKRQLVKELGYTDPVFRKVFRKNNPRLDVLESVCNYFDIDEEELTSPVDYERYGEALIPRLDC